MAGSNQNQYTQSVRLPEAYKGPMDWLAQLGYYQSRSDIIRNALRDLLRIEAPEQFYRAARKTPKRELHRAPTTVYLTPELLCKAHNIVAETPSRFKTLTELVNRALHWYFKYLDEGARVWEDLLGGETGYEVIRTAIELRNK